MFDVFRRRSERIIGDRVILLFETADGYSDAVYTAISLNSVCKYVLNQQFMQHYVSFGTGIRT